MACPRNIFVVGSKGIPACYGGYETFVDRLTKEHETDARIRYHVACKAKPGASEREFEYHGARCFTVKVPNIGPAQAIWYDVTALKRCLSYIEEHGIKHPIVYVLACRIGPFCKNFHRRIRALGGELYVNPDGHEWARDKWSAPVRRYWRLSESLMAKNCDLLICDSKNIEKYISEEYDRYSLRTTYIAYGADLRHSLLADDDLMVQSWYAEHNLAPKSYYLAVGRFVPENNYETMIREFMRSDSERDFALVTNVSEGFLEKLEIRTHFHSDSRIKFVGTIYDRELLMKVREGAYGYLHGHEVGGTNPSLLEALASTDLNLLLNVDFNREVAGDSGLYWSKNAGDLASLIRRADALSDDEVFCLAEASTDRICCGYSWERIVGEYAQLFLESAKR